MPTTLSCRMTNAEPRFVASTELITAIQQQYGLPAVTEFRDLGGSYNLNLLLNGAATPLVARVYHDEMTAERVDSLHRIRRYLSENGIPTAPVLPTTDGRGWTAFDGRIVEVENFVPSDAKMDSWERLVAGIPLLARLHDLLRAAPDDTAAATTPVANHVPAPDARASVEFGVAAIGEWEPTGIEKRYADIAVQLAERLWSIERTFGDLPCQLVHGDFWDNNVYFRDGEIVLVGDFDFLGERPRIDDLALTLFYASELFGRPAAPARLRDLARRYSAAAAAPLTEAEWAALPYAITRSPLCFIGHLPYNSVAHARAELVDNRGPQCEWALRAIDSSHWMDTFRQDTVDGTSHAERATIL